MVLRDQIGTQIDSMANLVGRMYEAEMIRCQIMNVSNEWIYNMIVRNYYFQAQYHPYRDSTPLTPHSSEAFGRPARSSTFDTFRIVW